MTDGTSQGLFIVVAIVIFGIFVVLAYILFEDTLSPAMASMFTDATEKAANELNMKKYDRDFDTYYDSFTPTDENLFTFESSTGTLLSYTGTEPNIVIPKKINGVTVKNIGVNFHNRIGNEWKVVLESAVIPNTVQNIENSAFRMNSLDKIILPDSVHTVGYAAFSANNAKELRLSKNMASTGHTGYTYNSLKKITIPENITVIDEFSFLDSIKLTDIVFHDNVKKIAGHSFSGTGLTQITLPKNLEEIGTRAFFNTKLTELTLPKTVTTLGGNIVLNSANLTVVNVPKHLQSKIENDQTILQLDGTGRQPEINYY